MAKFEVGGVLELVVGLNVDAETEEEAIQKAEELINSFNMLMNAKHVLTVDGNVHKVSVKDANIEWQSANDEIEVEETDKKEEVTKRGA